MTLAYLNASFQMTGPLILNERKFKACELVEQCYSGLGKFCPECTYDEKEVS